MIRSSIDEALTSARRADAPGLVAGLAIAGEIAWRACAGLASIEHGVPLTPSSRLRIGSVSKHFACALALLMADEGVLDLDDPVARHLPETRTEWGEAVRLRQLCDNTSGVADFLECLHLSGAGLMRPITSGECLDLILAQPLNAEPGTRLIYSAGGFLALSAVLERIGGRPMGELLRERLFVPAGMAATDLVASDRAVVRDLATPYVVSPSGALMRGGWGLELNCEGGIVSTLDDMLAWGGWLLADGVGRGLLDRLSRTSTSGKGVEGLYALGLSRQPHRGLPLVSHGGRTPGFGTELILLPDRGLVGVVIANDGRLDPHALARDMLDRQLGLAEREDGVSDGVATPPGIFVSDREGIAIELAGSGTCDTVVTSSGRYGLQREGSETWRVRSPVWDAVVAPAAGGDIALVDSGAPVALRRCERPGDSLLAEIEGRYVNETLQASYTIDATARLRMQGVRGFQDYRLDPVDERLLIAEPVGPFASFHRPRLHLEREGGRIAGFTVSTERTRGVRFRPGEARTSRPANRLETVGTA
ncbi:MAG: serine hydrolase domain-containing protein [Azospirillaceae bacterium]